MEDRLFQYIAANGNKVYEARKKYAKEGKKGDIEGGKGENNKDNSSAIIGRIYKIYAI